MKGILLMLVLAITVEGLVEYVKSLAQAHWKAIVLQMSALVVSILLCVLAGADLYAVLDVTFGVPYVGCILTGVFASRGANYASDMIGKLRASANDA